MIIRKDDDRNYIERNGNDYSMYINGWEFVEPYFD